MYMFPVQDARGIMSVVVWNQQPSIAGFFFFFAVSVALSTALPASSFATSAALSVASSVAALALSSAALTALSLVPLQPLPAASLAFSVLPALGVSLQPLPVA